MASANLLDILDLSKTLMYDFLYNYIKIKYGACAQVLFSDTDSLCIDVTTEDVYRDMEKDQELFNLSDYPQSHFLFNTNNKKVLGKMKDENSGKIMNSFIGLKPKLYSFTCEVRQVDKNGDMQCTGEECKRAKGVNKAVVQSKLRHELYKECLFKRECRMESMLSFRSYSHRLYTISLNKTSLNPFDDKRYILDDGRCTLAHGHCKIPKS